MEKKSKIELSLIIPVFNEGKNVLELHQQLSPVLKKLKLSSEVIFINDGSTDDTAKYLKTLKHVNILTLRRNFGQSAALDAGIKAARGKVLVTMDGDLQNDPTDIPLLLTKLAEGWDVVSGWRAKRHDSFSKKFISRGANLLRGIFVKDQIHDSGCTLKAYRAECFHNFSLFGEMHRFIPAMLLWSGFKVTEIKVKHHARHFGRSKYTSSRIIKGFLDMLAIWFWRKYAARPLHLFGGIGFLLFSLGSVLLTILLILRLLGLIMLSQMIWPMVGFFAVLSGIQFFVFGLMADILVKDYYAKFDTIYYNIKDYVRQK